MLNFLLSKLENSNIFLTGSGGVGKSYMTKAIIGSYRARGKSVVVLGSTGISAVEVGGVTLHSFFRLGLSRDEKELKILDKKQKGRVGELREILEKTNLIVIDEISMVSREVFDLVFLRLENSKFRGRIMVVGDFYQLPPVNKNENNSGLKIFSDYAFASFGWMQMDFTYIELIGSKRTDDRVLYANLSKIRVGEVDEECLDYLEHLLIPSSRISPDSTVLFGINAKADRLNENRLNLINSELINLNGYYESKIKDDKKIANFIKSINVAENLKIKLGAKVIFSVNKMGDYFNGEQGIIVDVNEQSEAVESIMVQKSSGEIVEVFRNSYNLSEFDMINGDVEERILASYYQFPLKLAYAITIHKSQSMSIENLVCDLSDIFVNGQLYVALSRAMNSKNLRIVYTKRGDFRSYIRGAVKIDDEIKEFYSKNSFIRLDNQSTE